MRGLAAASTSTAADLEATVGAALTRRLRRDAGRPLAVALSGGGDSLALTLMTAAWAREAGRPLLVLTVDHCLRPESAAWTAVCAGVAARLGATFQPLAWESAKPASGLPAAARAARHALLADAAREAGANVILLGHTADDVTEARRMRAAGSTTPEPREWGPSPVWPQGRGVFLLRPLLGIGRAELRGWLGDRGERWIDDPANDDLRFARARARRQAERPAAPPEPVSAAELAAACRASPDGGLSIDRAALRDGDPAAIRRLVAAACLSAAGTARPSAAERLARLLAQLNGRDSVIATLAGARIEADAAQVRFAREAGEAARGGLQPVTMKSGVWDGRFEVIADRPFEVRALAGLARRLPRDQQAALRTLPASARPALPAIVEADGAVSCPLLAEIPGVRITPLAYDRLAAACGLIAREPV